MTLGTKSDRRKRINKERVRKEQYNKGEAHTGKNDKKYQARKVREGCKDTCKRRCKEKITPAERNTISESFWLLGDRQSRWTFIAQDVIAVCQSFS